MTIEIRTSIRDWFSAGLNFVYPAICQICEKERALPQEGFVCGNCWSGKGGVRFITVPFCERCGLPFQGEITGEFQCSNCHEIELHFRSARSAVIASPLVLDVIHRYKYNRGLWFEPFLADLLLRQAVPILAKEKWDLIVPVPLYPVKLREREFNQAERLARHLSNATKIPIRTDLIRRAEPTRTQTQLSRSARATNVRQAFRMNPPKKLNGQKIILLDDVLTTGATTNACAKVLRQAGAGEICVWTVARGL